MRITPVSEEQASGVWPKGEYDAIVASAVEKTSKTGNPMIEVTLTVYNEDQKEKKIRDYLVSTDGGQAKIQRFCKSAGLWDMYQAGEICADSCGDANVRVKLGVEDGNDDYPPKNKIVDYLPRKAAEKPAMQLAGVPTAKARAAGTGRKDPKEPPTSDDIPF